MFDIQQVAQEFQIALNEKMELGARLFIFQNGKLSPDFAPLVTSAQVLGINIDPQQGFFYSVGFGSPVPDEPMEPYIIVNISDRYSRQFEGGWGWDLLLDSGVPYDPQRTLNARTKLFPPELLALYGDNNEVKNG